MAKQDLKQYLDELLKQKEEYKKLFIQASKSTFGNDQIRAEKYSDILTFLYDEIRYVKHQLGIDENF
jgi:hypothetical protein